MFSYWNFGTCETMKEFIETEEHWEDLISECSTDFTLHKILWFYIGKSQAAQRSRRIVWATSGSVQFHTDAHSQRWPSSSCPAGCWSPLKKTKSSHKQKRRSSFIQRMSGNCKALKLCWLLSGQPALAVSVVCGLCSEVQYHSALLQQHTWRV